MKFLIFIENWIFVLKGQLNSTQRQRLGIKCIGWLFGLKAQLNLFFQGKLSCIPYFPGRRSFYTELYILKQNLKGLNNNGHG